MFNLLPEIEKRRIELAYLAKRYQLFFTFLLVIILAAVVFLTPSLIAVRYDQKNLNVQLESLKLGLDSDDQLRSRQLATGDDKILALDQVAQTPPSQSIATVVAQAGPGVRLRSIFYSRSADGASNLSVRGVASTRENLMLFAERLEEQTGFASVTFPVSNFAKDRDIDFEINIVLNQNEAVH